MRNLAILRTLAPAFDLQIVTLVHDRRSLEDPGPVAKLGEWIPVMATNRRTPFHRGLGQLLYRTAGRGWSREAWFLGSSEIARTVARCIRERPPHLVHAAYWFTLRHLASRPRPPRWVLDTHDVQFERWERLGHPVGPRERRAEIEELLRNDLVIAITPKDAAAFRAAAGDAIRIETVGMGVDLGWWTPAAVEREPGGAAVVYYGNMAGEANRQAAVHLCREVLPLLREIRPGTDVWIVGADPAPEVAALGEIDGVTVTGTVEDPRPYLARCAVFALPFRAASGIRSRACEAMALGLPVVAYPEALAGMGFEPEREYLAADRPEEFARQVARLLEDGDRRATIAAAARARVERDYSLAATYGRFVSLYRELIAGAGPNRDR